MVAAAQAHRRLIFDLDQHRLARADIGDPVGEHVRTLLLDQSGALARRLGAFVYFGGLGAAPYLADDDALADHHAQRIDRGILRQRVEIGRRRPLPAGVAERLDDAGAGDRPADMDFIMGAEPDRGDVRPAARVQHQRAGADRLGAFLIAGGPGRAERGNRRHRQQEQQRQSGGDAARPSRRIGGETPAGATEKPARQRLDSPSLRAGLLRRAVRFHR